MPNRYNPDIHHRRSIRLKGYDYSRAGAYFVTICTHDRECLFGEIQDGQMVLNPSGQIARNHWKNLPNHYPNIQLDEFVVMPNHVHGVVVVHHENGIVGAIHELPLRERKTRRKMLLPKIVGYYKMNAAKQINQIREMVGVPVWQRNYHEHIIRDDEDLNSIREYIINNPLRWTDDENHPRQGKEC